MSSCAIPFNIFTFMWIIVLSWQLRPKPSTWFLFLRSLTSFYQSPNPVYDIVLPQNRYPYAKHRMDKLLRIIRKTCTFLYLYQIYQDDIFSGVNHWPQLRATTSSYKKWDVSFKQGLPWIKSELYGSINNINNEKDKNVLQMYPNIPKYIEQYGTRAELGLRIRI